MMMKIIKIITSNFLWLKVSTKMLCWYYLLSRWHNHKYDYMNGFLSRWPVCMFDNDVNYLLDEIGDHDDNVDPLFPDHPPERSTCVWHRALARKFCHFDNSCKKLKDASNLILLSWCVSFPHALLTYMHQLNAHAFGAEHAIYPTHNAHEPEKQRLITWVPM